MLAVYTFVFRGVLNAKWPGSDKDTNTDFALNVFCGLIIFNFFSEVIGRAPRLIAEQPNMVKKVIFPLEILAWTSTLNALFYTIISVAVLIAGTVVFKGDLSASAFGIIPTIIVFIPMLVGLSWLLSSIGVYVPDTQQIIGLILTPMLFLSPVFYPASALPEKAQFIMAINPLTVIIEASRSAIIEQSWPHWDELLVYLLCSILTFIIGLFFFRKTKHGFSDVL
jgi:lipopolysaccharide transport system permease protein